MNPQTVEVILPVGTVLPVCVNVVIKTSDGTVLCKTSLGVNAPSISTGYLSSGGFGLPPKEPSCGRVEGQVCTCRGFGFGACVPVGKVAGPQCGRVDGQRCTCKFFLDRGFGECVPLGNVARIVS